MRRLVEPTILIACIFAAMVLCAPLSQAFPSQTSSAAQLNIGGSFFDQIDSLLNNIFDINSLLPQTPAPSVNITDVKTANAGQSGATPQVIVTVKNGRAALEGVRVDVGYKNTAGATVLSDRALVALKSDETRSITFAPKGLSNGKYAIGVVVYKNGTDPYSQATPPYDTRLNAATLVIASSASSGGGAGRAPDPGGIASTIANVLDNISPWMYFIIAMTGLVTVALFFVFSQNRSGDDRLQDEHFKTDGYILRENDASKPPRSENASAMSSEDLEDTAPNATVRRPSRAEISPSKWAHWESEASVAEHASRATEQTLQFDADGFVVGDVTSRKALRNKMRGKKGS
jgi:hypothetical protein